MSIPEVLAKMHELRWVIGFLVVYFIVYFVGTALIFGPLFGSDKKDNKPVKPEEMSKIDFSEGPPNW